MCVSPFYRAEHQDLELPDPSPFTNLPGSFLPVHLFNKCLFVLPDTNADGEEVMG